VDLEWCFFVSSILPSFHPHRYRCISFLHCFMIFVSTSSTWLAFGHIAVCILPSLCFSFTASLQKSFLIYSVLFGHGSRPHSSLYYLFLGFFILPSLTATVLATCHSHTLILVHTKSSSLVAPPSGYFLQLPLYRVRFLVL